MSGRRSTTKKRSTARSSPGPQVQRAMGPRSFAKLALFHQNENSEDLRPLPRPALPAANNRWSDDEDEVSLKFRLISKIDLSLVALLLLSSQFCFRSLRHFRVHSPAEQSALARFTILFPIHPTFSCPFYYRTFGSCSLHNLVFDLSDIFVSLLVLNNRLLSASTPCFRFNRHLRVPTPVEQSSPSATLPCPNIAFHLVVLPPSNIHLLSPYLFSPYIHQSILLTCISLGH
jgi:hypothetical protein